MTSTIRILLAGFGIIGAIAPVAAHHGFDTEYDQAKKVSFTGVVTKVEWTNPHMHVYIDVTDAAGKVTNWNMEMGSVNTVQRQGWGRNTLLPGEKVTVQGHAGKVVETRGALDRIAKADSPNTPLFVAGGPGTSAP